MYLFCKEYTSVCVIFVIFLPYTCSTGIGKCPKLKFMDRFSQSKFEGRWYEIERSFYLMELISNCVAIDLEQNYRNQLQVAITSRSSWLVCKFIGYIKCEICPLKFCKSKRSEIITVSEGLATPAKKDPSLFMYKVQTKLPRILNRYLPGTGLYQVLHTDYVSYAILYSCTNYNFAHTDLVWIWAREREINVTVRAAIYKILEKNQLDSERLILPNNRNCMTD